MIDAEDEVFHVGDDPSWNDSVWFSFAVPERSLNGFVYAMHDPTSGRTGGGPAVWDPSGEETYTCRHYDWRLIQPRAELDYARFRLPNGLEQEMVEPLRHYRFAYDVEPLTLELDWRSIGEPHLLRPGHFDQAGRMTGSMVLDGERLLVDCWSFRDHTWGPQAFGARRAGDYVWGVASEELHFQALVIDDRVTAGFVSRQGDVRELVGGTRRATRRGGAPSSVVLDAVDDGGRALHAEGQVRTALRWQGWPRRMAFWTLTEWLIDGEAGWGEDQEFWPLPLRADEA